MKRANLKVAQTTFLSARAGRNACPSMEWTRREAGKNWRGDLRAVRMDVIVLYIWFNQTYNTAT